ncbi:MAG TPA: MoaD/ThiS family protein [Flavobacteriales bacterium]|mgnify:FL=1|jgi:molybdopterin converting factor subunit 1|nr:MoaD/ThiS family protein [Flavobacteriales bacterium]|tara:strand:- start:777 stop:1013 length:237 start_codon:yes stop_codon:yes gene_type:complete
MNTIKVLFFGSLEDVVGVKEKDFSDINATDSLFKILNKNYPKLNEKTFQVAVNQQIINTNTTLNNGDEIALLPPFAGG